MNLNQTLSKVGSAIVTADSDEVDDLKWYKIGEVEEVIARENNCSGMHFDMCKRFLENTII